MLEFRGKYNSVIIYTDNVEQMAVSQLIELCDMEAYKDSKIRVMPDVHAGKGATIGTTMTLTDKVSPAACGVDIGCGMHVVQIAARAEDIDLPRLDSVIKKYVPLGTDVRDVAFLKYFNEVKDDLSKMSAASNVDLVRAKLSMGTLGGGNHFIELDADDEGNVYLVIHTGSRKGGVSVAEYHQNLAYKALMARAKDKSKLIDALYSQGREKEIQAELKKLAPVTNIPKALAYVEEENFQNYLNDMRTMQKYADLNRKAIAETIMVGMRWTAVDSFTTVHNYIDLKNMILRKGAISAQAGERVLIPINNEDGALICIGKGNADWNCSAPHGAGRLMSRKKAKATLSVDDYKAGLQRAGVYSTTANKSTVDECAKAYKPLAEIVENIKDTVEITLRVRPFYNIKAGEED